MAVSADGHAMAANFYNGVICVWDVESGRACSLAANKPIWPNSIAISSNGEFVATHSSELIVWRVKEGKLELVTRLREEFYRGAQPPMFFSQNNMQLFTKGNFSGSVCQWDTLTGAWAMGGHTSSDPLKVLAVYSNSKLAVLGSKDTHKRGTVAVVDLEKWPNSSLIDFAALADGSEEFVGVQFLNASTVAFCGSTQGVRKLRFVRKKVLVLEAFLGAASFSNTARGVMAPASKLLTQGGQGLVVERVAKFLF